VLVAAGATLALVASGAVPARAAVDWGPQTDFPPDYAWNFGSSLATSGDDGTVFLHAAYVTDYVDGAFATDSGPYQGVYYLRSGDGGGTWREPFRLNAVEKHGSRPAVAADGSYVVAAWVTQESYERYDPADPRSVSVRVNPNDGDPAEWADTIRLSKPTGRVDQVDVAVARANVYAVWTDAKGGAVRFARSTDHGATWDVRTIGQAHAVDQGGEGHVGAPSVAASGADVGIVWIGSRRGTVKAAVSTNGGKSFKPTLGLADAGGGKSNGSPSADALGDRLSFAWTTGKGVFEQTWAAGWGSRHTVAEFEPGTRHEAGYDVAIALVGTEGVGVAWSDCRAARCDLGSASTRVDLSWSESVDRGVTWTERTRLRAATWSKDQRINDGASVVWTDPHTRVVLYDGWAVNYVAYDLFLKIGAGS
jgi:hypothetical protein